MSIWSSIFKDRGPKDLQPQAKADGVVRDDKGWYYEESQNFSQKQSTVRIEQKRPGNWELVHASCGIDGLNHPNRKKDVERFFAGSYRWLRLERDVDGIHKFRVKVVGTYRDKAGREHAVQLGFLQQDVVDNLETEDVVDLWGRIRFIKFPTPGRTSKYLIRFDLMRKEMLLGGA